MKRRLGATLLLIAVVAGCDGRPGPRDETRIPLSTPSSRNTRVIGLVGTLSGPDRWRGDDAFEGADLGVHLLNQKLPKRAAAYELVTLDDGGDAATATGLVRELAQSDRTVGIVYAGPPGGLPPAEEVLKASGIPAILCYGDLYSARLLSPHVFQASPALLWESRRLADYLIRDRGYRRIGLISSKSLTGQAARRSLTLALQEEGLGLKATVVYEAGINDVRPLLEALRRRRVQAIIVEGPPRVSALVFMGLDLLGARYRTTGAARAAVQRTQAWRPQIAGFDQTLSPLLSDVDLPPGAVVADSYARGAHYLPIPSLARFRKAFVNWWGDQPLGWERRAYEAVRMIGWSVARTRNPEGTDIAKSLESIRRVRLGGLDVTLGPDDHTSVDQTSVGLWVVPRSGAAPETDRLPNGMPWVPLGRGFALDGERTDIHPKDWRWMFRNAPSPKRPAPKVRRSRFGVTSPRSDPIH
jgi:ABC-type branched-subunit amino acid transport system substrate-binding protein